MALRQITLACKRWSFRPRGPPNHNRRPVPRIRGSNLFRILSYVPEGCRDRLPPPRKSGAEGSRGEGRSIQVDQFGTGLLERPQDGSVEGIETGNGDDPFPPIAKCQRTD